MVRDMVLLLISQILTYNGHRKAENSIASLATSKGLWCK